MLKKLLSFFRTKKQESVPSTPEIHTRFGVYGWVKHDSSDHPNVQLGRIVVIEGDCGCIEMYICGMLDWSFVRYYLLDEYYTEENCAILDKYMASC